MIKSLTIEKIIHLILVILVYVLYTALVIFPRNFEGEQLLILQFYIRLTSGLIIFYSQIFWLFPKYALNRNIIRYLLFSLLIILGLFLVYSFVVTITLQGQIFKNDHIQKSFFETYILRYSVYLFWFQSAAVFLFASIIYSLLKVFFQMIVNKGLIKVKTLFLLIFTIIGALLGSFVGRYYYYKAFEGNEEIILIHHSEEIQTLENLTELKEFKGNVLYIDIWGTYCGPCIREFQHIKESQDLKERYKDKPVKFIYLADVRDSSDFPRWKSLINKSYDMTKI